MKNAARFLVVGLTALLLVTTFAEIAEAAPPNAPTLSGPADGATVSANPVLTWLAPTGPVQATGYQIQLATTDTFSNIIGDQNTVNTSYTPPGELPTGTIYWRVRAFNALNEPSGFVSRNFIKGASVAPTPTGPVDNAVLTFPTNPVTLSWEPLPGMRAYDIEVSLDQLFTPPLVVQTSTAQTSYTIDVPLVFGQTYYWHVRGVTFANQLTQFSAFQRFSTVWNAVPQLVSPPDTQSPAIEDIVLQWNWVPGAATYDLQIATDISFNTVVISTVVKGTVYTPLQNLNNTSYFWRVRARTSQNVPGNSWSETRTFERRWPGTPNPVPPAANSLITQISPAEDEHTSLPIFKWTPFRQASLYEVQLSLSPHFETGVNTSCFTHHTEVTPYNGCPLSLASGQIYYWRVRGLDGPVGIQGLYSGVNGAGEYPSFFYSPNGVTLNSPANHAVTDRPELTWTTSANVGRYRVLVYRPSDQTLFTYETFAESFVPTNLAFDAVHPENNLYEWFVEGMDNNGSLSPLPGHPWRDFTLTAPVNPGASPTPDAITYTGDHVPMLKWRYVTGATTYRVSYKPVANANYVLMAEGLNISAYRYPLDGILIGNYDWKVEALNAANAVLSSATSTFSLTSTASLNGPSLPRAPGHCANPNTCGTTTPNPGTVPETPTFTWDSVRGATSYQLILARDANFTNVITTYSTIFNRLTPIESLPETQAGQAYYWFVKPCTPGRCSPGPELFPPPNYPPVSAFRKQSPPVKLTGPGVDVGPGGPVGPVPSVANLVTFTWEDYLATQVNTVCTQPEPPITKCPKQEAANYLFQVSQLQDFSQILESQFVDQTRYTPMNITYPEGPLYWRVLAVDASNNLLPFSTTKLVNKVSPTLSLSTPAANATVDKLPNFSWTAQNFAARYELEIYANPNQPLNIANRVLSIATQQPAFTPTTLLPPGTYGWRVRRRDGDDRPGPWTADDNTGLRKFTYTPTLTTLLSPANAFGFASGDNNMLFTWQPVPGAAFYVFQSSTSDTFVPLTEQVNTSMTAWAPQNAYPNGTFYWRVLTYDANSNLLGTSQSRTIVRGPAPPGAPLNVQASPGDSTATVTWNPPASPGGTITKYVVSAVGGSGQTCTWTSGPLTCTVQNLVNGTSYTFTVKATNANGDGPPSAPSNAVTPLPVPAKPNAPTATAGNAQATVTWSAVGQGGGTPITSYIVTSSGGQTCTWTSGPLTCTVTNLTNGVPYTFRVRAVSSVGQGAQSDPSNSVTPTSADWYHALQPARILDSRPNGPTVGPYNTPWGAQVTRDVTVAGVGGVPANADAVVLNVTVTGTTAPSFLTIFPKGGTKPNASSLNWLAGQTSANSVTVKVGDQGKVSVFNPGGLVHVLFDVVGYYSTDSGDGFTSLSPARLLDSRPNGPQVGEYNSPWGAGTDRPLQVSGLNGVPGNASAVVLNLTVTNTTANGFLTLYPDGQSLPNPLSSSINWVQGQTIANSVTAKLGANGKLRVYNPGGNVDVIVDVVGYFTPGTGKLFHPLSPLRIQDSRPPPDQVGPYNTPWGAGTIRPVQVTNVAGVPGGADSVLLNVTVTGATAPGFLTLWPAGDTQPNASSVNFNAGQTIPNAVTVKAGAGGNVSVFNPGGQVQVLADISGYYV